MIRSAVVCLRAGRTEWL